MIWMIFLRCSRTFFVQATKKVRKEKAPSFAPFRGATEGQVCVPAACRPKQSEALRRLVAHASLWCQVFLANKV